MLDKKDVQWWIVEAQKRPESAPNLIRALADRVAFLDKQNEELRGELITLRRKQPGEAVNADIQALQQRIQELEGALAQNAGKRQLLVYASDRIEANVALTVLTPGASLDREPSPDVNLLISLPTAQLLIITTESQAFNVALSDLPTPQDGPAPLGNPHNVAAILDQATLGRYRFLALVSRAGYVYSILAGGVNQVARRREKLIRNLIPDDPLVSAVPSSNTDLFALSRKGRWARFHEKSVAGAGSLVMDLPQGDTLANVVPLSQETKLLFLTTNGFLFIRSSTEFKARPGPGVSGGMVMKGQTFLGVACSREVIVLTQRGKLIPIRLDEAPYKTWPEAGRSLPGLPPDDALLAFAQM